MFDITKYILGYKKIKNNHLSEEEIFNLIEKTFEDNYNAICLDIDKTITDNQEIDEEMLEILKKLLKKNIAICFVTGRGRTGSKEVLLQVFDYMKKNKLDIKNITCATSNGVTFLNTDKSFFDTEHNIVSKIKLQEYLYLKNEIREYYISEIVKRGGTISNAKEILERSLSCTGKFNLRFAFHNNEIVDNALMINTLKEIILKTDLAEELSVFKGKHKDKVIYEVSIADKLKAVEYFAKKHSINIEKIVKIGDQADKYGNDYTMLRTKAGFSVNEIDKSEVGILPVIDENCNQEKGVSATKRIIKNLKFIENER